MTNLFIRHKSSVNLILAFGCLIATPLTCISAQLQDTVIEAEKITKRGEGEFILSGEALISQGKKIIRAETIEYKQDGGQVDIVGDVEFIDSDFKLTGSSASFNLQQETGVIFDSNYQLIEDPGNGSAKTIRIKSRTNAVLEDSSYTTCPIGENDWRFVASEIDLDTEEGIGKSTHTRLELYDVPVLYVPYYRFPIDKQRKTGFLLPQGGYSSEDGSDLRFPFYWNIAPNYDATITPRVMSKRGIGVESEFRYLLDQQSGEIHFDYLYDDDIYNDTRYLISFDQSGHLSESITNRFDLAYVSDREYFSDLGNASYATGDDHLNSSMVYSYQNGDWSAGLLLQAYQILDDDIEKQYQRLPQINLAYNGINNNWINQFNLELTNFEHPENESNPTGLRSDFSYKLTYDLSEPGWFVRPGISLRQTNYELDDSANESRTIYSINLDGGLIFERDMNLFGKDMVQTFEPRLFFLHTPYIDQQNLPIFDATENSLNFGQLFADNRFSGVDRVGDTTQLTAAVSSNVIDSSTGANKFSINMGEIFYLEDRKVDVGADNLQTQANSNFVANIQFNPIQQFKFFAETEWNHAENFTQLEQLVIEYRQDNKNRIGLSYLEQKDANAQVSVDAATLNFSWEYDHRWRFVGKWNYSLLHEATQESFIGFEFDSGCWAARLISRRHIEEMQNPADAKHQILFQIELLGVGGFGESVDEFIDP